MSHPLATAPASPSIISLPWLHKPLLWFIAKSDSERMKLDIVLTIVSAAFASSRTVGVPESGDDAWNTSVADTEVSPPGPKIPGQNSLNLCKGDHSHDAVCIELRLSHSPLHWLCGIRTPRKGLCRPNNMNNAN